MSAPASGKRPAANASLSEEHQPAKHDKVDLHQLDDTGNDAEDMSQADLVIDEEPASATAAIANGLASLAAPTRVQSQPKGSQPAKSALTVRVHLTSEGLRHFESNPVLVHAELGAALRQLLYTWSEKVWRPKPRRDEKGCIVFATKDKEIYKLLADPVAFADAFKVNGRSTVVKAPPPQQRKPRFRLVFKGVPTCIDVSSSHVTSEFTKKGLSMPKRYVDKNSTATTLVKVEASSKAAFYKAIIEGVWLHLTNYKAEEDWQVPQCYKCQAIVTDRHHNAKSCEAAQKCLHCAGDHTHSPNAKCPETNYNCANCSGSHVACSRLCPVIRAAEKSHLQLVKQQARLFLEKQLQGQQLANYTASRQASSLPAQQQPPSLSGYSRVVHGPQPEPTQLQPVAPATNSLALIEERMQRRFDKMRDDLQSQFQAQLSAATKRAEAAEKQVESLSEALKALSASKAANKPSTPEAKQLADIVALVGQLANSVTAAGNMRLLEPKQAKASYESAVKTLNSTTKASAAAAVKAAEFATTNAAALAASKKHAHSKSTVDAANQAATQAKTSNQVRP